MEFQKKQKTIACSLTEPEYRAIATTVSELSWIQSLLTEIHVNVDAPKIYCDNLGVTYTCANPVFDTCMKHLALDYFFVRERIQQGLLTVQHVPSCDQLADALNKSLSKA